MTEPLLDVRGLRTRFQTPAGAVDAVRDVSFTVPAGTIVGLVGESGSGKSVTARSILRLLRPPGRVVAGEVRFAGRDLLTLPEREMRTVRGRDIAMVFQDPQSALNPVQRVGEQVAEALVVHGSSHRTAMARAAELLDLVGIPEPARRLRDYPHEFSGGMRQRVVIATALANNPRLLIADEPTTALDVTVQAQILRLLGDLRDELGVAVLMITHDLGVVAETCSQAVVMYAGKVVERAPVAELFTAPAHPYTAALLRAVPRLDADRSRRLVGIGGAPPDPADLPGGCAFRTRCPLAIDQCADEPPRVDLGDGHVSACFRTADVLAGSDRRTGQDRAPKRVRPADTADTAPMLVVDQLRVDVTGGRRATRWRAHRPVFAVDGVSLHVAAGETLGLVGESGCGKSTLSRTIVGLNRPTSGRISADGLVQYVFQDPYSSLNPRRTIGQSLDEALRAGGTDMRSAQARAVELIKTVGLRPAHLDRYPHEFSGGQRQRIGIARALATDPRVLILDEPVSALDVSIQAQIITLLDDLRERLGLGYLFIAHDLAVVRQLSDRVAVMYLGRIVETGPADAVYDKPRHPYTVALLSSSPEPVVGPAGRERIVLTGDLPSPADPPSGCRFRGRCPIGPLRHPERTICVDRDPVLDGTGTHRAACHFPGELHLDQP